MSRAEVEVSAEEAGQEPSQEVKRRPWSAVFIGFLLGGMLGGGAVWLLPGVGSPEDFERQVIDDAAASEAETGIVHVKAAAVASGRISIVRPRPGRLAAGLVLNGEVRFDETRLARVVPAVGGVVRSLPVALGAHVLEGDVLAVIESQEFGQAKAGYLEALQALELAKAEHARLEAIQRDTQSMVDILAAAGGDEQVDRINSMNIGESKGSILVAHANLVASRARLAREKGLAGKGISSQQDYEETKRAAEAAEAEYQALVEGFRLTSDLALRAARNKVASAEVSLGVAERHLDVLGLSQEEIRQVADGGGSSLSRYEVKSPLTGSVVRRQVTVGEMVAPDAEMFTLADLTSVWAVGAATVDQVGDIAVGAVASIVADSLPRRVFGGAVWSLGAEVDERTRTLPVRCQLDNGQELLKPGMYVRISLEVASGTEEEAPAPETLILPSAAIQIVHGQKSVFVRKGEDVYHLTAVETGREWGGEVEILAGLGSEAEVAGEGSILLKAELAKGSMEEDE